MRNRAFEAVRSESTKLFAAALFAVLLVSALFAVTPAGAQKSASDAQYTPADDARQQAKARPNSKEDKPQAVAAAQATADPPADRSAQIIESTDDSDGTTANRVVISNVNCEVGDGATITVRDADGTEITLTDGGNVDIEQEQNRIVVVGNGADQNFRGVNISGGDFGPSNSTEAGTVVRSTGITCGRDDGDESDGADDDDDGDSGRVRTADDLLALDCDELLQRYRSVDSGQYATSDAFLVEDVEERIAVCLEREVIDDTDTDEDLPDTGGLPLLGLAVFGLASVIAGASVIRGVGRGE